METILLKDLSGKMCGNFCFESCALCLPSIVKYYSNSVTFYKYEITKLKEKNPEFLCGEVII